MDVVFSASAMSWYQVIAEGKDSASGDIQALLSSTRAPKYKGSPSTII